MFELLDDPNPPVLDESARRVVLRRAHRIRRRRTVALGTLAVVVLAGLFGVSFSVRPTTNESAYQFSQRGLSVGASVPTAALGEVIFADADDGFALVPHPHGTVFAATTDGGQNWQVVDRTLPKGFGENQASLGQFEFTTPQHGYLWGGSATTGDAPLWI